MASFTDRLRVARRALIGVFSDDAAKQAFGLLQGIFPAAVGAPPTRGARERVAAYADMPWLNAVADKVSSSVAAVEWCLSAVRRAGAPRAIRIKALQRLGGDWVSCQARQARLAHLKDAGDLVEVQNHPLLDEVLDGGNAYMTGLATRKVTALHWDLEGEAFWLKERSGLGVPIGVWPLPPHWVTGTPTPSHRFFRVSFRGWQGEIPDTEILWIANPDPSNPYARGAGKARALADELETDEYAAKTIRQTFFNQARPDFVVYPKAGSWTEPERLRLEQQWRGQHEGFWRTVKARFASRELGIYEFGATDMRHLQMVQLRQFERDMIIQVFGVPPEVLGIIANSNRATIQAASYIFARWVLIPRLEAFRAILQERLVPEYDDRLILDYVSPVEKDREFALEVGKAAPYSWTVDEWRALADREPLEDGAGERFVMPFNLTTIGDFGGEPLPGAAGMDLANLKTDELLALRRLALRDQTRR